MAKIATIDTNETVTKALEREFFTFKVRGLSTLITRSFNDVLQEFELTRSHWVVLACLWQQDGLPASTIAADIQQEGGTVSGVLDRMVKRNLIRRRRDRADRRVVRVWLTDEGKKLAMVLPPVIANLFKRMFAGISPEGVMEFDALIDKVIAPLSDESNQKSAFPASEKSLVPRRYAHVLPPLCIPYKIKVLQMAIRRRFAERVSQYNVTVAHFTVLCCLIQDDGARVRDIGDQMEAAGSALSGLIERMIERGLVRKQIDPADRRTMRVWITPSGKAMWQLVPPIATKLSERAVSKLSTIQRAQLEDFMDRTMLNLCQYQRTTS